MEGSESTQDGSGDVMGTGRERGWRPEDEYKIETRTGAGTKTRAVAETGTRMGAEARAGT